MSAWCFSKLHPAAAETVLDNVMLPAEVFGLDIAAARRCARDLLYGDGRLDLFENRLPGELSARGMQRASIASGPTIRAFRYDEPPARSTP